MTASISVRADPGIIAAAAAAAGVDLTLSPGDQARAVLAKIAGQAPRSRSKEGGELKRAGRDWEKQVAAAGQAAGFRAWDVAPLRGRRDLLDITGCIPDGWLIGAKSVQRGVPMSAKLWAAMDQAAAALGNLPRSTDPAGITPVQVVQRSGQPIGRAYAVTELDWFLRLAVERRQWHTA